MLSASVIGNIGENCMKLIGRLPEQEVLEEALDSKEAELIAVYGRRRVGKTFLIRSFFDKKNVIFFQSSGIHNGKVSIQLKEFKNTIEETFYTNKKGPGLAVPKNWMDAFGMLADAVDTAHKTSSEKIIVFMDEFPWMATHKSGLLEAFDYYWNRYLVNFERLKIIICGSAASWIIEKVLNNKGGLHNRVTRRINLHPFSLFETKLFLKEKGINWDNAQILYIYMAIGGIPYYLKFIDKSLSAPQNIDRLCFQRGGVLKDEFKNLFSSLFDNAETHEKIMTILSTSRQGVARSVIEKKLDMEGGRLTTKISELAESGFISESLPVGKERGLYYRIIDEYSIFYLKWIRPLLKSMKGQMIDNIVPGHWETISISSSGRVWAGYAFESVCFKHLKQISKALKIPQGSIAISFSNKPTKLKSAGELKTAPSGTQIDLIFDRLDGITNICEIKYCTKAYVIDKSYAKNLANKIAVYKKETKSVKECRLSMITSYKTKDNIYSKEIVSSEVVLDDFFIDV